MKEFIAKVFRRKICINCKRIIWKEKKDGSSMGIGMHNGKSVYHCPECAHKIFIGLLSGDFEELKTSLKIMIGEENKEDSEMLTQMLDDMKETISGPVQEELPANIEALFRLKAKKWLGDNKANNIVGGYWKNLNTSKKEECYKCGTVVYVTHDDIMKDFTQEKFKIICPKCVLLYHPDKINPEVKHILEEQVKEYEK